jgi:hypothetical protein
MLARAAFVAEPDRCDSWATAVIDHRNEGKTAQVRVAIARVPPMAPEPGQKRKCSDVTSLRDGGLGISRKTWSASGENISSGEKPSHKLLKS